MAKRDSLCLKDGCGILCVILVYTLLAFIYGSTVVFALLDGLNQGDGLAILNFIVLTMFTCLSLVSHIVTVCADPGSLPKNQLQLEKDNIPGTFGKLMVERESIYESTQKKRAARRGESVNKDEGSK